MASPKSDRRNRDKGLREKEEGAQGARRSLVMRHCSSHYGNYRKVRSAWQKTVEDRVPGHLSMATELDRSQSPVITHSWSSRETQPPGFRQG